MCVEARSATIPPNKKVPEMSHSMPTNVPLVPGIDNVPRTPRTPRGTIIDPQDPRFYPVVKDGTKPDPQVSVIMKFIFQVSVVLSFKRAGTRFMKEIIHSTPYLLTKNNSR